MLRLIGLVVVVLLVLSLAHGERTGGYAEANARAETLVDELTGRLAQGLRTFGDMVFGPGPGLRSPSLRDLPADFDTAVRAADGRARRTLAASVLRACPSLGLICQPAVNRVPPDEDGSPEARHLKGSDPR